MIFSSQKHFNIRPFKENDYAAIPNHVLKTILWSGGNAQISSFLQSVKEQDPRLYTEHNPNLVK